MKIHKPAIRIGQGLIVILVLTGILVYQCNKTVIDTVDLSDTAKVVPPDRTTFAVKTAKGIYKKTDWNTIPNNMFYKDTNITGITLLSYWKNMNPAKGVYDWTRIDEIGNKCQQNGLYIAFNIAAGCKSPDWILNEVPTLTFLEFHHVGTLVDARPIVYVQPVIWDSIYIDSYVNFIRALGVHCATKNYWNKINIVSLTGVNRTTEEVRLPLLVDLSLGGNSSTNADSLWATVGYSSAKVIATFKVFALAWAAAFPASVLSYAHIATEDFLPLTPDVFSACAQFSKNNFSNRLVFKYTAMSSIYQIGQKQQFINSINGERAAQLSHIKYQFTNDKNDLIKALDLVVKHKMRFLEMDEETVVKFPNLVNKYNKLINQ